MNLTIRTLLSNMQPLIHCITNPISINQCANAILATSARPIMAEHPKEVAEITQSAQALLLNLGNISDVRMESMLISLQVANECNIPVILDAVGVACSSLRRQFANRLLNKFTLTVVKGNYSEIVALYNQSYTSSGVDVDKDLTVEYVSKIVKVFAKQHHVLVLASGKVDIISDGLQVIHLHNGTAQLASVTGTGCMLGALCACMLAVDITINALICACALLAISGEDAQTDQGSGSFMVHLLDQLSTITDERLQEQLRMENIDENN